MDNKKSTEGRGTSASLSLRPMCSDDIFGIVSVISAIGLPEIQKSLDPGMVKAASFKEPMQMKDGKVVPLPRNRWTQKQKDAEQKALLARSEMSTTVLQIIMSNFMRCRKPVYELLAVATGTDAATIQHLDPVDFLKLVDEYVSRESFMDFFTRAASLLAKSTASNSFSASMSAIATPTD